MKKWLIVLFVFGLPALWSMSGAQDRNYTVMFYNVENLFDTIKSPDTRDDEFTPTGAKAWNSYKYWSKMEKLEEVFYKVAQQERTFPTIIGLAEVENRNVLEDLVVMPRLERVNYQIVHYDSPDRRGVDVALFYRPDVFKYEGSYPIPTVVPDYPDFKTRDILSVWGTIEGERFCFFVCHWPSRLGGEAASEYLRVAAASCVRQAADSILRERPDTKIVVMGDMNDDPANRSLSEVLGGKEKASRVGPGEYFNPFWEMHRAGLGTLAYNDAWNLFDNMIVSENLLNAKPGTLRLHKKNRYYGYIFNQKFLLQKSGQYKNYPLRTFVGDNFQNGYSDHFPVYIILSK